jgi:hypothetical protein
LDDPQNHNDGLFIVSRNPKENGTASTSMSMERNRRDGPSEDREQKLQETEKVKRAIKVSPEEGSNELTPLKETLHTMNFGIEPVLTEEEPVGFMRL